MTDLVAIAWRKACDLRNSVDDLRFARIDGLTRREQRLVDRIVSRSEVVQIDVCRLQASLSERSKLQGIYHPAPRSEVR